MDRATAPPANEPSDRARSRTWRWTAGSGVALLVLVTIHMVAHHFVVHAVGGLRSYESVLQYIATPVIFVLEALFLVVVTIHSMFGLRSVLFDFGLSDRAKRAADRGLIVLGVLTVVYGFVLIGVLAARA